jgi:hypothetical protein
MIAIMDFHPLRIMMSKRIHAENIAATPIEIEEMMVNARGGVYAISCAITPPVIEVNMDTKHRYQASRATAEFGL